MLPPLQSRIALCAALFLLGGCDRAADREPIIGEAFAGPEGLVIHKEIDPKSPAAATLHHGDHLDILAQRRRWYKVRTPGGAEGWTDDRQLLDTGQMNRLVALRGQTAGLPSQGTGTTFGTLNVHSEPNRLSMSFVQVKEGEKFDVVAHRVYPRSPLPKRQILRPRPIGEKKAKGKGKKENAGPPPPAPPAPPPDWIALSKERSIEPEENLPPAAHDDWTLIRTANGMSGWVLTSRVYMAIPDEVAQYAAGRRITSYFMIGKTRGDSGEPTDVHPTWLWTTSETLGEDHDFDSFRVFTWNVRRHRYETAYIQRRERGFFPVLAKEGQFSVCLENEDGVRVRKSYKLVSNLVRGGEDQRCEAEPDNSDVPPADANIVLRDNFVSKPGGVNPGMLARALAAVKGWFGK